ncbi:MAG: TerB family tellurite resistance protein, partial [Phaeodactylibacter sp.]|nr:TerB family tellurite resistance protein [Phaeodactylibacter sp.]
SRPMQQSLQYSAEDKREAIVEAFKKVADSFYFDANSNSWTVPPPEPAAPQAAGRVSIRSKGRRSEAESQLAGAPLKSHFEKEVLARLLVELANVDGQIKAEEKEFLQAVIGDEFGSMEDLLAKDPVSQIECEELPAKSKETIYMLAWVMSLVDFDIDPAEKNMLLEYADMMGLSNSQVKDITQRAKLYLLEKSISVETSREELFEIADQLDLDHQDAERCLIQVKKKA